MNLVNWVCAVIILCEINQINCDSSTFQSYPDSDYDNTFKQSNLINSLKTESKMKCVSECSSRSNCLSSTFVKSIAPSSSFSSSNNCYLYNMTSLSSKITSTGSTLYARKGE